MVGKGLYGRGPGKRGRNFYHKLFDSELLGNQVVGLEKVHGSIPILHLFKTFISDS